MQREVKNTWSNIGLGLCPQLRDKKATK